MLVQNADGSIPEMCGNGARCAALWIATEGCTRPGAARVELMTDAGPRPCNVDAREARRGRGWREAKHGGMRKSPSSCRGGPSASVSTRRTGCACEAPPSWCSSASSPARRLEVEAPVQRQRLRRRPGQAGQRRLAGRDERHVAGVCGGDALGSEGRLAAVERELDHEMVLRLVDVEIEARAEVARIRQMDAGLAKTRRGDALRW